MILKALVKQYEAEIASAQANIEVNIALNHPKVVSTVDREIAKLANARNKLNTLHEFWEC